MAKEWVATLDASGTEIAVSLSRTAQGFVLQMGEQELQVDAAAVSGGRWSLLIGDRSVVVDVIDDGERLTVVSDAGVSTMLLEDARQKELAKSVAAGRDQGTGEVLLAPIAGKVVKLFVEPGTEVAPGEPVIVLEAMKMENEIKAARGGTVAEIHVEPGASVETRAKLVTIE